MEHWTAFILGLAGSLHCAGMCGPLALALPNAGPRRFDYLLGRIAYNLGRLATYCGLGLVVGLLGRTLALAGFQRWVSISLGVGLLVGLFSSRKLAALFPMVKFVGRLKAGLATLLRRRSIPALALLGLLNGLLPCGLVYVAATGATATGGIVSGAQYMFFFWLGTFPLMMAISLSGRLFPISLRLKLRKAIPASVVLLAALLILRGLSLGIPYLSPDLAPAAGDAACCHKPM